MSLNLGRLELFMGPTQLGAPDDLLDVIVSFIDGSRQSLDVAVQELESRPIADALIRARQRGVSVRVVLEGDYLSVRRALADPWSEGGTNETNRQIHDALQRAKIEVKTDFNPDIFHQKFIIRDKVSADAAILTGSTNFTPTGVASNLNHILIAKSKRVAREYSNEFREILDGTFGSNQSRRFSPPRVYCVAGVPVKILFAPDHSPEMEIMKQMLKAKKSVDFAMFTFSRSSGIDDTLIALARSGIKVRGILDGSQGKQRWAPTKDIKDAGAEMHLCPHKAGLNKLHHKLAVIDGEVLVVGSFNFTGPANRLNDENILVIGDLDDDKARSKQMQLGSYALDEIDRMINEHGEPV